MELSTREKAMAVVLIATIIVAAVVVALVSTWRISSVGKIRAIGVEVYADRDCTTYIKSIDWGWLDPGDLAGVMAYCRNSKNVNFTMTIEAGNWTPPEAGSYLFIDWNYTGHIVQPLDVVPVLITLYAATNISGIESFSFDILIIATEV